MRNHRSRKRAATSADTKAAFTRLAALTLNAFPATLVPNPMVAELDVLAREAGLDLPLTEEIAADIFMGRFSAKYFRAATLAGERLRGTLYARYYRLDYDGFRDADSFGWYCLNRAPRTDAYLASKRRIPFNEYDVFRQYPELDRVED